MLKTVIDSVNVHYSEPAVWTNCYEQNFWSYLSLLIHQWSAPGPAGALFVSNCLNCSSMPWRTHPAMLRDSSPHSTHGSHLAVVPSSGGWVKAESNAQPLSCTACAPVLGLISLTQTFLVVNLYYCPRLTLIVEYFVLLCKHSFILFKCRFS